ncbi:MAG: radical SAM protein [Beijerinckiaceae bacterium]
MDGCFALYRKAAAAGSPVGNYWLGILSLDYNLGDQKAGLRSLEKAADAGLMDAKMRLAVHLLSLKGDQKAAKQAVGFLEEGAAVETPTALSLLSTCRRFGMGCKVDLVAAEALLRRAVAAKAPGAAEALAEWEAAPPVALPVWTADPTESLISSAFERFSNGDLDGCLKLHRQASKAGSPVGDYWLGILALDYNRGDKKAGLRSLEKAADAGVMDAKMRLAVHLLSLKGDQKAAKQAVGLLEEGAAVETPTALSLLSTCRRFGIGCKVDLVAAEALLRRAVAAKAPGAAEALAAWETAPPVTTPVWTADPTDTLIASAFERFSNGDMDGCLKLYRQVSKAGSPVGDYWLGILALDYNTGDKAAGLLSLDKAANAGLIDAKMRLATHLLTVKDDPLAPERAVALLEEAAAGEMPAALTMLSTCRRFGMGCKVDLVAAEALLRRAVAAKAPGAEEALADWKAAPPVTAPVWTADPKDTLVASAFERFSRGDLESALELNKQASEAGSSVGDYWLGILALDYNRGDQKAGLRSLEKAAGAGLMDAKMRLAVHHLSVKGDPEAAERAVALLEEGAAVEIPAALSMLSTCRRFGMGCEVDLVAAEALLRRAVEANSPGSAEALAEWEAAPPVTPPAQTTDGTLWMRHGPEAPVQQGPATMTLEVTTRCNLACVMCPHGLEKSSLIKRDAPDPLVDKLIKSFDTLSEVHPTGVGEPMLADGFWRIVDALQDRVSPRLVFHTNGILLTDRNVAKLARAPLSRVNVSIDAADPMTYRRIRGAEMRKTTDGVKRLVNAVAKREDRDRISIALSMVLMRENISEAKEFVQLAHSLGVRNVYFEHLTEPHLAKNEWIVKRNNFQFVYAEQELYDSPQMADNNIIEAMDEADRLGVIIEGYQVLLGDQKKVHENRPCRTGAFPKQTEAAEVRP